MAETLCQPTGLISVTLKELLAAGPAVGTVYYPLQRHRAGPIVGYVLRLLESSLICGLGPFLGPFLSENS